MVLTKKGPRLIHPALNNIPQDLRYLIGGLLNTVILMTSLWIANASFKEIYSASTIYTFVNLFCIPIGHAVSSLLVFGWPQKYFQNLCLNAPISIVGTVVGSLCTEFFDRMEFDAACYKVMMGLNVMKEAQEGSNMFSSVLVMIITGLWSYVLSNIVNSTPKEKTKHDKEL